ncbi:MAG: FAD-dependent oxidoreductase [bacterium]|nr:FAD-dependent oxidoreductase [bacterium]
MNADQHTSHRTVAVFGAGIAGLSTAHEFARRGYKVSVYEVNPDAGGFFRSARMPTDDHMPSEYSWHGIGPWYHNVFDLMKQIPFDETGSMYDKALSRPIAFGLVSDKGKAAFDDTLFLNVKNMFRMSWLDVVLGGWLMMKTWTANRRTVEQYATCNAAQAWRPLLRDRAWKAWRSSFGPWVGSDWKNVSLHTAGQFFRKQLIMKPSHFHKADEQGPAWWHGSRDGWLLLRGPSSEYWFDRWVAYLKTNGVEFFWEKALEKLDFDGEKILVAHLESGDVVRSDVYVLATNPFAAADILERTPDLEKQDQLRLLRPLVQDGPHIQVSLRIAFSEKIAWPKERMAVIVADSEFNLTLFAEEQAWDSQVSLGNSIKSLWTVTACVSSVPGPLFGLPLSKCTKEQFIEEVKEQLFRCEGINTLIQKHNRGRELKDFPIVKIEVWHEWLFSSQGITSPQPKWVNTTNTQQYLPTQATPVLNLVLAGAHTKTQVDVWSIEAAVESGRRAAQVIIPDVKVVPQYKPIWLRMISALDDVLFAVKGPHILNVLGCFLIIIVVALIFVNLRR